MILPVAAPAGSRGGDNPCRICCDKETMMAPDPEAEYWDVNDIAEYLGVAVTTVHTYRFRGKKNLPGGLPPEDKVFGRSPVWKPATIISWPRPGRGAGGGRPRKDETGETS